MKITEIIEFLDENGLSEIEELKVNKDYIVLKFYYDFDKDEISAARAYANEESDLEEDSDEWFRDWYLSFLTDIAIDNVDSIIEDLGEELELMGKAKEVEMDVNNADYIKFHVAFCSEDFDGDLEDVLNDYLK